MATQVATPTLETSGRAQVAGTRTQVVGMVLLASAPLTMFAIGAATGAAGGEILPLGVIGSVLMATAWLVRRFGTWSTVAGLALTVLAVLAGFWMAFGLLAVDSPADFVPGVLFVLGVGLSLSGGVRAVRSRHRPSRIGATPGEGRARLLVVAVVALATVVSLTANLTGRQTVEAAAAADATPVTIEAFDFASAEATVPAGSDAALLVSNRDAFLHDLAIPSHDIAATVTPGSQALLDVSGLDVGTYTFYCTLHSDTSDPDPTTAGMAGTLVVQ